MGPEENMHSSQFSAQNEQSVSKIDAKTKISINWGVKLQQIITRVV